MRREIDGEEGSILADEPGLGKTIQTLFLMAGRPTRTLIVVPNSIMRQWHDTMIHYGGINSVYLMVRDYKLHICVPSTAAGETESFEAEIEGGRITNVPQDVDTFITTFSLFERFNSGRTFKHEDADRKVLDKLVQYKLYLRRKCKQKTHSTKLRSMLSATQKEICRLRAVVQSYDDRKHNPLRSLSWGRVVIDEAHQAKRVQGVRFQELQLLRTETRLLLSGTPLHNTTNDLAALLISIGVPADAYYKNGFVAEALDMEQQDELADLFSRHSLRRHRDDVYREAQKLPGLEYVPVVTAWKTDAEKKLYENVIEHLAKLKEMYGIHSKRYLQSMHFKRVLHLRQVCVNPEMCLDSMKKLAKQAGRHEELTLLDTLERQLPPEPTKLTSLRELLRTFTIEKRNRADPPDKVIIFFHWKNGEASVIERILTQENISYVKVDGSVSGSDARQRLLDQFKAREPTAPNVLLAQISVGGVGLNLSEANKVVLLSPDWNPTNELQALHRAYRHGQTRVVRVYGLSIQETQETEMLKAQYGKLEAANRMYRETHHTKHMDLDKMF
jgi:SNF2 family DNA or RNA helicase